jgi:hypothetical protein
LHAHYYISTFLLESVIHISYYIISCNTYHLFEISL